MGNFLRQKINIIFRSIPIILAGFFIADFSFAVVVGKFGSTYQIKERDAYEEILEKARTVNKNYLVSLLKKSLMDKFEVSKVKVKKAEETTTRRHVLNYTLPFDIKDHNGRIIYPKGYSFNPLDYVKIPFVVVFFDGTSGKELEWLKKSGFLKRPDTMLVAVKGNIYDLNLQLKKTVYAGSKDMLGIFGVEKTPSYVYQESNYFIITEVGVYGQKNK